ncbi:MAG: hypothetical protein GC136_10570 [Alphaproteobacteria bacterium]|nr:hypothetical protein [Alphaproteobacteria bacterium]
MSKENFDLWLPREEDKGPLVYDVPHAGRDYPADYNYACDLDALVRTEDRFMDLMLAGAEKQGIPLITAKVSRSYIDLNRPETDIDPRLLRDDGDDPYNKPGNMWHGLIRRFVSFAGDKIYDRLLAAEEIEARIENVYRPYHAELKNLVDETCDRHGYCVHLNWHSMPSQLGRVAAPDIIFGSMGGKSAPQWLLDVMADWWNMHDYDVRQNYVFRGQEITRRYGQPESNRFSVLIEINRALYLDENTYELKPEAAILQQKIKLFSEYMKDVMKDFNPATSELEAEHTLKRTTQGLVYVPR